MQPATDGRDAMRCVTGLGACAWGTTFMLGPMAVQLNQKHPNSGHER